MHYDPARYLPQPVTAVLADRWTTEMRQHFGNGQARPTCDAAVVLEGRGPLPPPPPVVPEPHMPTCVKELISEVTQCLSCLEVPPPVCSAAQGQVASQRPPFHAYQVDTLNVLPPRPIKESTPTTPHEVPMPTSQPRCDRAASAGQSHCKGCRFCAHFSKHKRAAQVAADTALRREAVKHLTSHSSHKSAKKASRRGEEQQCAAKEIEAEPVLSHTPVVGAVMANSGLGIPSEAVLRSTQLFLCEDCGRVTKRLLGPNDEEQYLQQPCEGCGQAGALMRLFAEDRRKRSKGKPSRPSTPQRDRTALDEVVEVVQLQPRGVVPMTDRRTALGERIHVGRARVPSPSRSARVSEVSERCGDTSRDTLLKWAQEPLSANDSAKAKLCLTWVS